MATATMNKPVDGWLELVRWIDGIRAEQAQAREVIHAHQERFDDFEYEVRSELHTSESEVHAQMKFIGHNLEEVAQKIAIHTESHKLRDRESEARLAQMQMQRVDLWKVVIVALVTTIGSIGVALITGLLK